MISKKIVLNALLFTSLVTSLQIVCNKEGRKSDASKTVLSSFYPVYITVMNLTKDVPGIGSSMLTQPGTGCLHNYQLTPVDMVKIEKTGCMVINGAGMEPFLDKIITDKSGLTIIDASIHCNLLKNDVTTIDLDEHDNAHHHHETVNPHVWLSPTQYITQIRTIASGLCTWDPAHTSIYQKNMASYIDSINQLKTDLDSLLIKVAYRDIITFHSAFSYFASDYNLKVRAVIQQEPGQEPSAAEMMELITIIKTYNIRSVFVEPQYQSKTADVLSRETGVHVDTLDPVVTGDLTPDAYIRAMRRNGKVLHAALSGERQ